MNQTLFKIFLTSSFLCLIACSDFNEEKANEFQSLTQLQQAHYWQQKNLVVLLSKVRALGITVNIVGDQYEILFPASYLFKDNTSQLYLGKESIFKAIADLIKAQSTAGVYVQAYSGAYSSREQNFALTQSWADTVTRYLRDQDLQTGFIAAQGHGECDNISKDSELANRIEIHYQISHED